MHLKNQTAVVTGGGQGIGRAICMKLAEAGCAVAIADISKKNAAETVALIRKAHPVQAEAVVTDLRSEQDVINLAGKIGELFGSLDILVNNSGIAGPRSPIEDISLAEWNDSLAVNITGMFLTCKHLLPLMRKKGKGSIVNIASTAGLRPLPFRLPYATTKRAVIAFSQTLALELGPAGIRVNTVCPGAVDGPRQTAVLEKVAAQTGRPLEEVVALKKAEAPLNTFIAPEDIGSMIVYLCGEAGAMITGTTLNVSAGLVLS